MNRSTFAAVVVVAIAGSGCMRHVDASGRVYATAARDGTSVDGFGRPAPWQGPPKWSERLKSKRMRQHHERTARG
jgi:hypothetical protein